MVILRREIALIISSYRHGPPPSLTISSLKPKSAAPVEIASSLIYLACLQLVIIAVYLVNRGDRYGRR
jgi:hypothetical protein